MQHWNLTKELRTTYGNIHREEQDNGSPFNLSRLLSAPEHKNIQHASRACWISCYHSAIVPSLCRHTGFFQLWLSFARSRTYSSLIAMPRPGPCGIFTAPSS